MIAHVKGIVEDIYEDRIVIDVNGFGVNVFVTNSVLSETNLGDNIKLFTYTLVREDTFNLYGFLKREELFIFKKLITVNGIGPKAGISLLSILDADSLRFAILSGDTKLIASAPGIGKKTAEKVILELKDKLKWDDNLINIEVNNKRIDSNVISNNSSINEAINALMALGYNPKEAHVAVNGVSVTDDMDVEAILKAALSNLM